MEIGHDFTNPEYYRNRELSWLEFNHRVLGEARDPNLPVFERLKFLSITASNLDEFFMVRVASLKDMVHAGYKKTDIAGLKPEEQLSFINEKTHELVSLQYSTYNYSLVPKLRSQGIILVGHHENLSSSDAEFVDRYFLESIYPVITPMAVDSSRPFPLIRNKTLNIAVLMKKKQGKDLEFATVQVPSVIPRFVELPEKKGERRIILLEEIIERNIASLFLNYDVKCAHPYRIMRNADLTIDEEEAADLLKEIKKQLKKRQWGEVIRLEVEEGVDQGLLKILKKELLIKDADVYLINGPLDLTFLMKLYGIDGVEDLKIPAFIPQPVPQLNNEQDIFTNIQLGDVLLHHPYQSFQPVVDFINQASADPNVLAIKQTLYRVSGKSSIIAALEAAAENGKQVSVLVELKARFDEENNINWALRLEKAGCHVIYGLVGLKTHSKITLVVRREEEGIRRYVHLGTGNYNDTTAKLYTDLGILTCKKAFGEDATALFNMLSGYSEPLNWNKLYVAPIWLRKKFLRMIAREKKHALQGKKSHIIAKMNSLSDKCIIAALYEASAAGVEIDLIIRGICCLKVGILGVSEHIHVHSIVGNFLEHSRIFYFYNNGCEEIYMGSADWMPRNLDKRVELLFPIEDQQHKDRIRYILDIEWKDNMKSYVLKQDGSYEKPSRGEDAMINAQEEFCIEAKEVSIQTKKDNIRTNLFTPVEKESEH